MKKIVINRCFGGFGLSHEAMMLYAHLTGVVLVFQETTYGFNYYYVDEVADDRYFNDRDIQRDDPDLVKVVETLGEKAAGGCADLCIVEIPDDVEWELCEYDGNEWVAEKHRVWR